MYRQQGITAKPTSLVKETPSRPPMQVLIDIASEIAADLAERVETEMLQEWQVIFRLAKRLQSIPGIGKYDVTKLYPVLENFCDALTECGIGEHVDFSEDSREERWLEFIDVWHKVRFPDGTGPLELAFARAKEEQIVPAGRQRQKARLQVGTTPSQIWLIRVIDGDYSYAKHKAKTYEFLFDSGRYVVKK